MKHALPLANIAWALIACSASAPEIGNGASQNRVAVTCPAGLHPENIDNLDVCAPNPVSLAPDRRFEGTMVLGFENQTFVPTGERYRPGGTWLSFADSELERCLADLGANDVHGKRYRVVFIGRPDLEERPIGNGYGHLGMFRHEIEVTRFLSGNPCAQRTGR